MVNPGHASQPWESFTLKHRLWELFPFLHCPSQPFGASTSSLVPWGPSAPSPKVFAAAVLRGDSLRGECRGRAVSWGHTVRSRPCAARTGDLGPGGP